jgi:hypothetical protein
MLAEKSARLTRGIKSVYFQPSSFIVVTPFAFRGFFLRHEADSGSCGSHGPREQVSEMPAFWPANIAAWFASVEGVF